MKKKSYIQKIVKKDVIESLTVCEICGKSLEHEDNKEIYIIRLKRGDRGIHNRRQWETKESWYFCKDCLDVNIKLKRGES